MIRGVGGFPRLKADNFVFDSRDGGLLTLAGEVQVEGQDGTQKFRLCAIGLDNFTSEARIVKAKSLLDDFAESQTLARKLALLDDITAVYSDDELPPEATWLLAMKLLEPHLTWRSGEQTEGGRRKAEGGKGNSGEFDRSRGACRSGRLARGPLRRSRGCGKARRKRLIGG